MKIMDAWCNVCIGWSEAYVGRIEISEKTIKLTGAYSDEIALSDVSEIVVKLGDMWDTMTFHYKNGVHSHNPNLKIRASIEESSMELLSKYVTVICK